MNQQTQDSDLKEPLLLYYPCMKEDFTTPKSSSYFFSLIDREGTIDIKRSFVSSPPRWLTIIIRLGLFGWSTASIILGAFTDHDKYFYLAYLTNCTAIISLGYQCVSAFVSILPDKITQPKKEKDSPPCIIKTMWILYSIAAPAETAIVFLFWTFDYKQSVDGPVRYCMVFEHGILASLILIDGTIIGRIPLRRIHCICVITYMSIYFAWNVMFSRFFVEESSPIYDVLDWRNDFIFAAFLVFLIIAIVSPVSFLFCWMLSIRKRRYLSNDDVEVQQVAI